MASTTLPSRYIPHNSTPPTDIKAAKHRIHEALAENVVRAHRHPSTNPKVYHGSAGEIIMDMRTFSILPAKTFPNNPTSSLIADPFHEPHHGSHVAYLETSIGPATLVLVRQLRLRQAPDSSAAKHARRGKLDGDILDEVELSESWRGAMELIGGAQETALSEPVDDDGCEVLYGRAGLLYALLLLRSELVVTLNYLAQVGKGKDRVVKDAEALCGDSNLKGLVDDIIQRGELGAQRYADELEESEKAKAPPLMWKWRGSRYLGAAHGVVGILHTIVHAPPQIIEPHWDKILRTVEWLLIIQDSLGNWPSKARPQMPHPSGGAATGLVDAEHADENDDALVQWCHGAPGFLMFFSALLRRSTHSSAACALPPQLRSTIVAATTRAGELVYARGLLRKGVGLCHGVGGNVYALLSVSDMLDSIPAAGSHAGVSRTPSTRSHHGFPLPGGMSRSPPLPDLGGDNAYWLRRTLHLADLATTWRTMMQDGRMEIPEHAYSLYGGVAGMVCAWAEVWTRLMNSKDGIAHGNGHGDAPGSGHVPRRGGMPGFLSVPWKARKHAMFAGLQKEDAVGNWNSRVMGHDPVSIKMSWTTASPIADLNRWLPSPLRASPRSCVPVTTSENLDHAGRRARAPGSYWQAESQGSRRPLHSVQHPCRSRTPPDRPRADPDGERLGGRQVAPRTLQRVRHRAGGLEDAGSHLDIYLDGVCVLGHPNPKLDTKSSVTRASTGDSVSGRGHGRAVFANFVVRNAEKYTVDCWVEGIKLAVSAGFDALALSVSNEPWEARQVANAFVAASRVNNGSEANTTCAAPGSKSVFKLFLSFNMTSLPCSSAQDISALQQYIRTFANHTDYFRYNGRMFVSTFAGEECPSRFGQSSLDEGWKQVLRSKSANGSAAPDVWFMPAFFAPPDVLSNSTAIDGLFNWNSAWPSGRSPGAFHADQSYLSALGNKTYMAAVSLWSWAQRDRNENRTACGTEGRSFGDRWETLIKNRANVSLVEVVTWGDDLGDSDAGPSGGQSSSPYGEKPPKPRNSSVSDSDSVHGQKQPGKGILEQVAPLMRYYIEAFKSGSYPSVARDEVFLWVQAHPRRDNCPGEPGRSPRGREWVQDRVSAYTLLSEPGNATLTCGPSSNTTAAVSCGLSKLGMALHGPPECCKVDARLIHNSEHSKTVEQQDGVDMEWVRRWVPLPADWESDEDLAVLVPVPVG